MDASDNLAVITDAQGTAEAAHNATTALHEAVQRAVTTITAALADLGEAATATTIGCEAARDRTAGALDATDAHLAATPGDHTTVPFILTARSRIEEASGNLMGAVDTATTVQGAVASLTESATEVLHAMGGGPVDEMLGQTGTAVAVLSDAAVQITAIRDH